MPISSAISAVVTFGSPRRLNITRLLSTIRSRVRRGRLRSAMTNADRRGSQPLTRGRQPGFESVQSVRQVARRLAHAGLARPQRTRIDQRVANGTLTFGKDIQFQPDAVSREHRCEHVAAREQALTRFSIRGLA